MKVSETAPTGATRQAPNTQDANTQGNNRTLIMNPPHTGSENPNQRIDSENPFAISRLRLTQDFAQTVGVKKALITIPVRKPNRQEFIRVHPDENYRLETAVLELKEDREIYLVAPDLWPELPGELTPRVLYTTLNRQNVLTLWPVRLPQADGRLDAWSASALEAANLATRGWVRVAANISLGAYEVYEATGEIPEPEWPEHPLDKLLEIAFKERYITTVDHPVIRRLRGEC